MDDNIDSMSDITQKPLRPRQPIIANRDVEEHAKAVMKHFQSEINVSSPPEIDRRFNTLPNKNESSQENRPQNPGPVNRPRVRPLPPSRPVSAMEQDFVGRGIDAQQVMWCRQSTVVPQQLSTPCNPPQTGSAFSRYSIAQEPGIVPAPENRRAKPMRSQSLYANETGYYQKTTTRAPTAYDQPLNVNSDNASSPYNRRHGSIEMYGTPSNDRMYSSQPRSNDLRHKSRGGSVPPEDQQMAGYVGGDQCFPPSDPSGHLVGQHSSGDAGLGSQYNPGNVRHLVHSFQQALKPGGSNSGTPQHSQNTRDRRVRPGSAAAALSTVNGSSYSGSPSHSNFENSKGIYSPTTPMSRAFAGTPLRPENRMDPGNSEARPDTNVCVVRPASGRSLPQPPPSNELTQLRNDSSAAAGSGTPSSRPSSAKAAKPSVYYDYGSV